MLPGKMPCTLQWMMLKSVLDIVEEHHKQF